MTDAERIAARIAIALGMAEDLHDMVAGLGEPGNATTTEWQERYLAAQCYATNLCKTLQAAQRLSAVAP